MSPFLTIGIGASAGGIAALKEFFEHVPAQPGTAFVVILHLSPSHDSQLAEVLQQATKMPVQQVTEQTRIEQDHIYVIPPDKHLTMEDGHIIVSQNTLVEERRAPVDIFFRSLAESHRAHAVGIILSGTGANGSMGLKRIKERGGAVFVQNPREAEFNEMPRAAIATDLVDAVLNVAEIPERILAYRDTLATVPIAEDAAGLDEHTARALREVLTQLRLRTGHDFANYKRPTLLRRIERRMAVRTLPDLPAYAAFILQHPEETQSLLKDLLISVTNFFRDKKVFEEVEGKLLPQMLADKGAADQIRIWVAGCATGEEAYSLAMLCADLTTDMMDAPRVQIFATDIDEAAIAAAREGFYTLNDAADVPPERLSRYFNKEGDGFRIRRELRETVLFATHNFLKDPPFSRLDLVSCRNVLIYLNHAAQERVMDTFHFALRPGGFLLLGSSESVDGASELFGAHSREHHIWQRRPVMGKPFVVPESVPRIAQFAPPQKAAEPLIAKERISVGELHQGLLELYAPPSLVVNEEYDIVHLSERAGRYLRFAAGEPSQALLKVAHEELHADLRSALYSASQRGVPVSALGAKARIDDALETLNIHVRPMPGGPYLLVIFEPAADRADEAEAPDIIANDEPAARHLEAEIARLKAQLRASNDAHEFANEEMKAGNEELQAMNEELRSATEELETSKEELQSINEELVTVNQELKVKVEEMSIVGANLQNIIASTNVGTIILDRSFRVMMFTPAARNIYNLIPSDQSRPISDITNRLREDNLVAEAGKVLESLQGTEREVETTDGLSYLVRVQPYRTQEDRIQGVVITFLDITERRQADTALREKEQRLQRMVNVPGVAVLQFDYDGKFIHANDAFLELVGYSREEFEKLHATWRHFTPPEFVEASKAIMRQLEQTGRGGPYEKEYFRKDGSRIWLMFVAADLGDGSIVEFVLDISDRKRIEGALRQSEERLKLAASVSGFGVHDYDIAANQIYWSPELKVMHGVAPDATLTFEDVLIRLHSEDRERIEREMRRAMAPDGDGNFEQEFRMKRADNGETVWLYNRSRTFFAGSGAARKAVRNSGIVFNITERKEAEQALRESEERLRITTESAIDYAIITMDAQRHVQGWSRGAERILGWSQEEVLGESADIIFTPEDRAAGAPEGEMITARDEGMAPDERWHLRKDGSRFFMSGVMRPIYNGGGAVSGYVKVARDMTERHRQEEQRETFIGVASHELKTPLSSIKAYSEVLQDMFAESGDEQSAKLMGKMEGQIDRLTALVRALLDVTRIREGKLELEKESFALDVLLRELAEEMQVTTAIELRITQSTPATVLADRKGITQVVVNLLSNAIKYARGTERIELSVGLREGEATVCVRDFGIGMSREESGQVFERFYRAQTAGAGTYPGLGLGLYISAEIVRLHGGRIWVESEVEQGSLFCFSLPV